MLAKPNYSHHDEQSGATHLPARYHLIMPVWNAKYIDLFVRYALPAQLTAGNLFALPAEKCLYQIFTREQDVASIRSAPSFKQLENLLPVSIEIVDNQDLARDHAYVVMTRCYERGLACSKDLDTAFLFLTPDCLWSDGTFSAVLRRIEEGKRAVITLGLRACLDQVVRELDLRRDPSSGTITLPPREQMRLALTHLHPLSQAHVVEGSSNRSLGHYYWQVGEEALIARCFHLHPLMVRPVIREASLYTTLDHEYVRLACPRFEDVHLVTDSDELCSVELSDPGHLADWVSQQPISDSEFNGWVDQWTNSYHRRYFSTPVVLHTGDIRPEYRGVVDASTRFVERVLTEFHQRNPSPMEGLPVIWTGRLAAQVAAHQPAQMSATPTPATPVRHGSLKRVLQTFRGLARSLVRRVYRTFNYKLYCHIDRLERLLLQGRQEFDQSAAQLEQRVQKELTRIDTLQERQASLEQQMRYLSQQKVEAERRLFLMQQQLRGTEEALHGNLNQLRQKFDQQVEVQREHTQFQATVDPVIRRLTGVLAQAGMINFAFQDPADPTNHAPLGYPSWDLAYFVYRPVFQQALSYLQCNGITGEMLEFGTYRGFTARCLAEAMVTTGTAGSLYLYDSFCGLPTSTAPADTESYHADSAAWAAGTMAPEPGIEHEIFKSLSQILDRSRVRIVKGFFEHTLQYQLPRTRAALIHLDCDLYSSTRHVLEQLSGKGLLQDGCVVLCDDYNCNSANPTMGERAALQEFLASQNRWTVSPWFAYGWHGQAFLLHDRERRAGMPHLHEELTTPSETEWTVHGPEGKRRPRAVGLYGVGKDTKAIFDLCKGSGTEVSFIVDDRPEDRSAFTGSTETCTQLRSELLRAGVPLWTPEHFERMCELHVDLPPLVASAIETAPGVSVAEDAFLHNAREVECRSRGRIALLHPVALAARMSLPTFRRRLVSFGFPGSGNPLLGRLLASLLERIDTAVPTAVAMAARMAEQYFVTTTVLVRDGLRQLRAEQIRFSPCEYPTMNVTLTLPDNQRASVLRLPSNRHLAQFVTHHFTEPNRLAVEEYARLNIPCFGLIRHPGDTLRALCGQLGAMGMPMDDAREWFEKLTARLGRWHRALLNHQDRIMVLRYEDLLTREIRPLQIAAESLGLTLSDREARDLYDQHLSRPRDGQAIGELSMHQVRGLLRSGMEAIATRWNYSLEMPAICSEEWFEPCLPCDVEFREMRSHSIPGKLPMRLYCNSHEIRPELQEFFQGQEYRKLLEAGGLGLDTVEGLEPLPWQALAVAHEGKPRRERALAY